MGTAATSAALPHDAARRHIAAPPQDEISLRNNLEDAEVAVKKPRLRVRLGKA